MIINLSTNEIKYDICGGECWCECHHPVSEWGHPQSKKGKALNSDHCRNILCNEDFWDNSRCTNLEQNELQDIPVLAPPHMQCFLPRLTNPFSCTIL